MGSHYEMSRKYRDRANFFWGLKDWVAFAGISCVAYLIAAILIRRHEIDMYIAASAVCGVMYLAIVKLHKRLCYLFRKHDVLWRWETRHFHRSSHLSSPHPRESGLLPHDSR